MLDVLLVNPGNQAQLFQDLSKRETAIEPPVWLRLLGSYLDRKGVSVELLDAEAVGLDGFAAASVVQNENPRVCVAVAHGNQPSASTQNMPAVIEFCRAIKSVAPDICLVVVGGHPAALPELTLEETGADFIVTGEGPVAVHAVLEFVKDNPRWRYFTKVKIPGVAYWDHDNFIHNDPAPNVWKLEEMPGGMWNRLSMSLYRSHNWHADIGTLPRQPYASIYTSLNCPYQCSFCCISSPFKEGDALRAGKSGVNLYRTWSPTHVADEIEDLVTDYGVSNIKFADEMYVLNRKHVIGVADELIKRGIADKLNIWAYARIDTLKDDELLEKMRVGGVRWVCAGIESISEYVRDGIDKNDYTVEDIIKACNRLREHGINLIANLIYGLPDDSQESINETFAMIKEIQPEWLNTYCAVAYPGTELYRLAKKEGWKLPDSWLGYSHHSYEYEPLRTKYVSAGRVLQMRDDHFQKFYTDPSYLSFIEKKFGVKAVEEINKMTAVKLKRRLLNT